MASPPSATPVRTATRRPPAPINVSLSPLVLAADVFSYGFAAVVMFATLQFDLQFTILESVAIMALFVALRGVAHEIRKDARRTALREARRLASLRRQSPSRWSVEQRDGVGRRVDVGA